MCGKLIHKAFDCKTDKREGISLLLNDSSLLVDSFYLSWRDNVRGEVSLQQINTNLTLGCCGDN